MSTRNGFENLLRKWNRGVLRGAQLRLARELKVDPATISRWTKSMNPPSENLRDRLAMILGVSRESLMAAFADPRGHSEVAESGNVEVRYTIRLEPVPIRGMVSASGVDYQPDEPPRGFTPFVIEWPMRGHLDALRVSGKSMEPTVRDGEYVIVRRDGHADVRDGSLVVVRVDGQLFLKRIYRDGDIVTLKCDNPKHKERRYAAKHVEILGVAIMAQEEPRRL